MMKHIRIFTSLILFLLSTSTIQAQAWPASTWNSAMNLTNLMDADGITDLSGLHFNPVNNRLYAVQGDGRVRVLQWNAISSSFTQIASKSIDGGPEGITQANLNANEFYTIDENNYEIRRYTYTANFSTVTEFKHWKLLNSPSPMQDTGNTGPEGIVFVPDSFLSSVGFISQQTGQLYTSVKGLGGLFFVAHQDEGYVWVFDVNPNTNNDFAYVGKYKTNKEESCDLAFDRSAGLMYILHNVNGNTLEVTNLSTIAISGGRQFLSSNEFNITNPGDGNENIEGFALTPKCINSGVSGAWLCRDVESNEDDAILQDALRWFNPFDAAGSCAPLVNNAFEDTNAIGLFPNPTSGILTLTGNNIVNAKIKIYNSLGQLILKKENQNNPTLVLDIDAFETGIYFLEVNQNGNVKVFKVYRN